MHMRRAGFGGWAIAVALVAGACGALETTGSAGGESRLEALPEKAATCLRDRTDGDRALRALLVDGDPGAAPFSSDDLDRAAEIDAECVSAAITAERFAEGLEDTSVVSLPPEALECLTAAFEPVEARRELFAMGADPGVPPSRAVAASFVERWIDCIPVGAWPGIAFGRDTDVHESFLPLCIAGLFSDRAYAVERVVDNYMLRLGAGAPTYDAGSDERFNRCLDFGKVQAEALAAQEGITLSDDTVSCFGTMYRESELPALFADVDAVQAQEDAMLEIYEACLSAEERAQVAG